MSQTIIPTKRYITPDELRKDSFALAGKIAFDGFKPDFIVGVWRGGAPIGCYVHEFLKVCGINADHIAIRTSRYTGIDQVASKIEVHNLGYLLERLTSASKVLLIDDVWDSGLSMIAILDAFKEKLGPKCPTDIRVGTIHYKPSRNKTTCEPNYYVHLSSEWLVYPHEISDLTMDEIVQNFGEDIGNLIIQTKSITLL